MTDKKQRVYIIPKRKGVADYWHEFRTWIGNTANDIYNAYEEGTKDLDKYYVNMQGSIGGLSDEGEIYIPTQDNASDHIQKVTAKDALDGTLVGLAESGLLSSTLAGAISAPVATGTSMMLPYAVDYANQHNIFGGSNNQKEMASDLAAFMPIGGLGKKFINPRTFKYNFYPKQYVKTAMRRDVAKKEIENINTAINEGTYNQTLDFGNKIKLNTRKNNLNAFLANTNSVDNFYLLNRLQQYKNSFNNGALNRYTRLESIKDMANKYLNGVSTNYNGTNNLITPLTYNINSVNITNRLNRVNNALANTQIGTKRYNILMQEKNRLNALRNNTNANLFDDNKLINYIVNNPKTAYATAGMISTLPFLYPYDSTSVNTTRPPLEAEYPTSSNTTVPPIISSTDTTRVNDNDSVSVNRADTIGANKTKNDSVYTSKPITITAKRNNSNNDDNTVQKNLVDKTNTSSSKTNTSSSKTNTSSSKTNTSSSKTNTSSSKTNTSSSKTNTSSFKSDTNKTKRKSKKQKINEAEQQAKLAQLRQAMADANNKVLDDATKEEYAKNGRYMNPKIYKPIYGINDELIGFKYVKK